MYKFTEKNDLDKLESYVKSLLHMLANKPLETSSLQNDAINAADCNIVHFNILVSKQQADKKKHKKGKKH